MEILNQRTTHIKLNKSAAFPTRIPLSSTFSDRKFLKNSDLSYTSKFFLSANPDCHRILEDFIDTTLRPDFRQKERSASANKVEKILKGNLDSIPSPSMKIQIMSGKICLKCKSKTLLGDVNKLLKAISNVLPYYLK